MKMSCPQCQGTGVRTLRLGPEDGVCPTCGGAGAVAGNAAGTEQSNAFVATCSPCTDCGGSGIKPLRRGGTREGVVQLASASNPNAAVGGNGVLGGGSAPSGGAIEFADDGNESGEAADSEAADSSSDNGEGFLSKYRTHLIVGGGALLVVALVATQLSKKK